MINIYNIYSEDIFEERYAVWKLIPRTNFLAPIIGQELLFEYQFCTIVDLFSLNDDNKSGHFENIEDYKNFLIDDLDNFEEHPIDNLYFGGYPQKLDKIELEFFMKNWKKKQAGYLYPKIYDAETKKELPAYLILLSDFIDGEEKRVFRGLAIPETEAEIESLLFENQLHRIRSGYESDGILKFDYPYHFIYSDIQKTIIAYLKNEPLSLEKMNKCFEELNKIKDVGVKKYLIYILKSFTEELENKKLFKSCKHCNVLFEYKEDKKYCNEDCKIQAKNRRYYSKNHNTIKKKRIVKSK